MSTFKLQYAGQGLIVSKHTHQAVKIIPPAMAAMASKGFYIFSRAYHRTAAALQLQAREWIDVQKSSLSLR
jgi:hypothetical protein